MCTCDIMNLNTDQCGECGEFRDAKNNGFQFRINYSHNGQTLNIAQWADYKKMKYRTLHRRLRDIGWSLEKALSTPVASTRKKKRIK